MITGNMCHIARLWLMASLVFFSVESAFDTVTLSSYTAGASGVTATVSFVTDTDVAATGKIKLTFPSTYTVASSTASSLQNINAAAVSLNGNQVILTISGATMTAGIHGFTIDGITNPPEGTAGDWTMITTNSGDTTIETIGTVAGATFTASALTSTSVALTSSAAGAVTTAVVSFTTAVDVPVTGLITITFPAQLGVATTTLSAHSGLDASSTVAFSGQVVTITIVGTPMSAGAVSVTLNLITNPAASTTSPFSISTSDASLNLYQTLSGVSGGLTLVAGSLTSTTLVHTSLNAGVTTTATLAFTSNVDVPSGGKIVVTLPGVVGVATTTLSSHSGIHASSTVAVSGQVVTITLAGAMSAAAVSVVLDAITNPGAVTTAVSTVQTQDSLGRLYESSSSSAGNTIVSTALSGVSVTPASLVAGATGLVAVALTTAVDTPLGGTVVVTFPSCFTVQSEDVSSQSGGITSASGSVTYSGQSATLTLAVAAAAGAQGFSVNAVSNPGASTSSTYTVTTYDANGYVLEQDAAVTGSTFTSSAIVFVSVTIDTTDACSAATALVKLQTTKTLFVNHYITVTFPANWGVLSDSPLPQSDEMPTAAVTYSGQVVTITITGAALTAEVVTFTLNKLTTAGDVALSAASTYPVATYDACGNVIETGSTSEGSTLNARAMPSASLKPATLLGAATTALATLGTGVLALLTDSGVAVGSTIVVTFPSAYTVTTDALSSLTNLDASSTVSTSGSVVTITVVGTAVTAGAASSITLNKVTTPSSTFDVGRFLIQTTDAGGLICEEISVGGGGCSMHNECWGHGQCSLLHQACVCDDGWGSTSDAVATGVADCSLRVCAKGSAVFDLPSAATAAHAQQECGGMGLCDRTTGVCSCFDGWTGAACNRRMCPNDCSGHGRCMSMREQAALGDALPLSAATTYKGAESTTTWDETMMYGCVCDSSWAVGLASGETQLPEWFGPDCSLRRCPSGDDPMTTSTDETDCNGVAAVGGQGTGASGNLCHVDCANRGICNYNTGQCKCFEGYRGVSCATQDVLAK